MSIYVNKVKDLKNKSQYKIKIKKIDNTQLYLRVINSSDLEDRTLLKKLTVWRKREEKWFASQFNVTSPRTKKWLQDSVIDNPLRILFVIEDDNGNFIGHAGFNRYRSQDNSCELDNVVRGIYSYPGLMTNIVLLLTKWSFINLRISKLFLTTFKDNERAVQLYLRCGFKKIDTIPLRSTKIKNEINWIEDKRKNRNKAKRYYLRMKYIS